MTEKQREAFDHWAEASMNWLEASLYGTEQDVKAAKDEMNRRARFVENAMKPRLTVVSNEALTEGERA